MYLAQTKQGLASLSDLNYAKAMHRHWALFGILFLATSLTACGPLGQAKPAKTITAPVKPMRIVSLDFCADQYVLKLIEPNRILALSPDAKKPISYLRRKAETIRTVRPNAEDVLQLKPDLIIRSYGGGPNASGFFQRAGVPVINIGWAGDFDSIKTVTQDVANGLGETHRGAQIVQNMDRRIAALKPHITTARALYMTPSGTTAGTGTFVHEILTLAGLENFQTQSGWRDLPLERLAYEHPDLIAAAFFDTDVENGWSAMRHPIARHQMEHHPAIALKGSWMSCGAWFAMDAVEALTQPVDTR